MHPMMTARRSHGMLDSVGDKRTGLSGGRRERLLPDVRFHKTAMTGSGRFLSFANVKVRPQTAVAPPPPKRTLDGSARPEDLPVGPVASMHDSVTRCQLAGVAILYGRIRARPRRHRVITAEGNGACVLQGIVGPC